MRKVLVGMVLICICTVTSCNKREEISVGIGDERQTLEETSVQQQVKEGRLLICSQKDCAITVTMPKSTANDVEVTA